MHVSLASDPKRKHEQLCQHFRVFLVHLLGNQVYSVVIELAVLANIQVQFANFVLNSIRSELSKPLVILPYKVTL